MTRQEIMRFLGFAALGALAVLVLRLALLPEAERPASMAGTGAAGMEHMHPAPTTGAGTPGEAPAATPDLVLENTTCPIMGGKALPGERMVIEGIEVHLCCPACEDVIRQDPRAAFSLLLKDPGSAAALRAHLQEHPEKAAALGVTDLLEDGR